MIYNHSTAKKQPFAKKLIIINCAIMPVQGNIQVEVPVQKTYDPLPKDVYHCQLLDIEEKEQTVWGGTDVEMVYVFTFVVLEEGEHYGRRLWVYAKPKLSKYGAGSTLYNVLVGLNDGKEFTDEEVAEIEGIAGEAALNALIGKQVRLTIGQQEKKNKKGEFKNTVDSYLAVKEELPEFDPEKVAKEDGESAPENGKDKLKNLKF